MAKNAKRATPVALTIAGVATVGQAAPARDDDSVTRAVRSPNGKDVFVRLVKVPKAQALAETVKPLEKISDIRIFDTGGLVGRGSGTGEGVSGSQG